jgi:predicted Holliday junction resolvase-like endonuclease
MMEEGEGAEQEEVVKLEEEGIRLRKREKEIRKEQVEASKHGCIGTYALNMSGYFDFKAFF